MAAAARETNKNTSGLWPIDDGSTARAVGITADTVEDVILTHMHYDHAGNFHKFPKARFQLREPEMHDAAGRHMRHKQLAKSFEPDDVRGIVRLNLEGRVTYHNGPAEVVLVSEVTHFYENMESYRPFTTAFDVGATREAFDTHAPSPAHIVPGHDPEVPRRYPAVSPDLAGIAGRLNVAPLSG